ncbi:site-2 protease family protein [Pelagimonas sp. KU-00592-HH]|uniref:site-2 protease family protein n=1 Tax=Pelagimonas sp. KU-00592-HH TaxID=3127651 RepID=UPI0031021079
MSWSISLGRLLGSEVRIHLTFFLLLAWIGWAAYVQSGPEAALRNVSLVIALFACVLAHEYGHALVARRFGIRTPDITLLPIGGMARLEKMPEKPREEILMAIAGPAVNVVIWFVLAVLFGARPDFSTMPNLEDPEIGFFAQLAMINLFLAVFNMIPAFPMDGGRVFRAALSLYMSRVQATRIAAAAGQLVALLLAFLGLNTGNPILILVAFFVFIAANAENQDVAIRAVTRRLTARDAMITTYETLSPTDTASAAAAALIRTTQHEFPVEDTSGALLGFVTRNAIFHAMMGDDHKMQPVAEIMTTDIPRLPLTAGLEAVLDALHKGAPAVALISASSGQMVGYVTKDNVGELMVLKGR